MSNVAKSKSDLSRAFSEDGARKTHVGGQALLEGVMMRGKYNWAVGVREPDGGVYEESHDLASGRAKNGWMYWPCVRGCRAMVESLVLGYKALEIAALHAFSDDEEDGVDPAPAQRAEASESGERAAGVPAPAVEAEGAAGVGAAASPHPLAGDADVESPAHSSACDSAGEAPAPGPADAVFSWKDDFGRPDTVIDALGAQRALEVVAEPASADDATATAASEPSPKSDGDAVFGKKEMAFSMVLGLVMGVVLFIVAPAFITNLLVGEYDAHTLAWNIVDGIMRVAVFVFYIWLIGRMSDIKRMFGYHGAEHKTIHCYEHGLPLTPENARQFPRLHVRCGTAFLIMVMIIAILVYTVTPLNALISAWGVPDGAPKLALVIAARIALMPVIAGISYEITVRWAGSHPENPLVKVVLWPGMQMQYLTTNEPDDGMLECAIAAMQQVLEREELEAAKAAAAARGAQA
ncbi:DUF1385 domain-containing protein [uncultured Senegalimassilia sp.]|uniref:DUF1385 domain-containing protein n=1 Tax=uncultured Senegalimassilia sp. TaxID=1714350 RepID=UPI0025E81902|nr:DUF1385 domain-containing protein [uncultured Senegalimassilia sp.]